MSLSFGAISLTKRLLIYNSPLVISSRPATILSVVDFPHPEGPTKTINSWSFTSKLKSKTACTLLS